MCGCTLYSKTQPVFPFGPFVYDEICTEFHGMYHVCDCSSVCDEINPRTNMIFCRRIYSKNDRKKPNYWLKGKKCRLHYVQTSYFFSKCSSTRAIKIMIYIVVWHDLCPLDRIFTHSARLVYRLNNVCLKIYIEELCCGKFMYEVLRSWDLDHYFKTFLLRKRLKKCTMQMKKKK